MSTYQNEFCVRRQILCSNRTMWIQFLEKNWLKMKNGIKVFMESYVKIYTYSKVINSLRGIDNCLGAALKDSFGQPILVTIFLYFNFYKQCWPYMVSIHIKYFLKTRKKTRKFRTNLLPYKNWVTGKRTCVNKGCKLLNPCLLTVLWPIPINKLPCLEAIRLRNLDTIDAIEVFMTKSE